MTYEEVKTSVIERAANAIGCVYTYECFEVGSAPDPAQKYIIFRYPGRDDFFADNKNYAHIAQLDFELYSDTKAFEAEEVIEGILEELDITYQKTDAFLESEQMYCCLYEMEVMING